MDDQMPLEGRVALITGASRGQGEATARLFVRSGCRVVLADVLEPEGRAVAASIGGSAAFIRLDVGNEDDWRDAVHFAQERFGRLDILVNNAAVHRSGRLEDTSLQQYEDVVRVNQVGCFLGMRAFADAAKAQGGVIVNISSVNGLMGVENAFAYGATKYAVRGMSKSASVELAKYGIRVNSVYPGAIDTPMIDASHEDAINSLARRLPIPRLAQPEEVAELTLFLSTDASRYCTGAEFVIDGGLTVGPLGPP